MASSRYLIGIDLGTTNSALSYIDTLEESPKSEVLPVAQLNGPGKVIERRTLPSFCYLGTKQEIKKELLALDSEYSFPRDYAVGIFAVEQLATVPGRVIQSAKSWLCHDDVDREAKTLPWASDEVEESRKLSPVEASAGFLRHLRDAWNSTKGAIEESYAFEKQDITITVPASFDEAAQRLTRMAAKQAGYPDTIRLVEEPQAAFYHWLEDHNIDRELREKVPVSASGPLLVLICDIGGGTTDFSLFEVDFTSGAAPLEIKRIAVSDHLLLGGDNIDLTIAHRLEGRIIGNQDKLNPRQWAHLVFQSRQLKEKILAEQSSDCDPDQQYHVSVPGKGSSLLSSALSGSIDRREIESLLLDGFFPICSSSAVPEKSSVGLKEWGLPFVSDSAVTRHLAKFLHGRQVDAVLYNGGTLKPEFLRNRITEVIGSWQQGDVPLQLSNREMDLAVTRGAARFGWACLKQTGRIRGGYARSIYLELHSDAKGETPQLICILPKGFEEGHSLSLEQHNFLLLIDQPVRFQLYHSSIRTTDAPGDLVVLNPDEFHPLPPLQTVLSLEHGQAKPEKGLLKIKIESVLNNLGVLELYCISLNQDNPGRWQLEFSLRKSKSAAAGSDEEQTAELGIAPAKFQQCAELIYGLFGKGKKLEREINPRRLIKELEKLSAVERNHWSVPLLRALWQPLSKGITRRGRSIAHEAAWLNLAGFCLRPGYGSELDSFRIMELWRCFELGLAFPKENSSLVQWWIMWRRVAGGLNKEQQTQLIDSIFKQIGKKTSDIAEMFRLASSLERLAPSARIKLGDMLVKRLKRTGLSGHEHCCWAVGRLASRMPLYGELNCVLPPEQVERWFDQLGELDWQKASYQNLNAAFSQAARVVNDRSRDLPNAVRQKIGQKLKESGASAKQIQMVSEFVEFNAADQTMLFGEALPSGLRLA